MIIFPFQTSDPCLAVPGFCLNGGTCEAGEAATCSCAPGYEGERCEVRTEAGCAGVRCPANTRCEVTEAGVACVCLPGYSGDPCTLTTDLCGDSPCQHGGVCSVSSGTGFTCSCPPGYQGDTCETDIAECEARPCMHGGVCSEPRPGNFTCSCAPGWQGPRCERDVNECEAEADPCVRGVCSNTVRYQTSDQISPHVHQVSECRWLLRKNFHPFPKNPFCRNSICLDHDLAVLGGALSSQCRM